VPDRFLRADLAEAAAGEAAADGEGQRDPFAGEHRRQADHDPDERPGVRPGDEAGEERSFERQIGGVVVQQQPRHDAAGERNPEAEREGQAIGPGAALENEDVAETAVANQHRRQRRHHRELDNQGRQQHLHRFTLILSGG
jgi:hypothetical protein